MTKAKADLFLKNILEAVAAMQPWVKKKPVPKLPPRAGRPKSLWLVN